MIKVLVAIVLIFLLIFLFARKIFDIMGSGLMKLLGIKDPDAKQPEQELLENKDETQLKEENE